MFTFRKTAKRAAKLSVNGMKNKNKRKLNYILAEIRKEANKGETQLYSYDISEENVEKLKNLGYEVTLKEESPSCMTNLYIISWLNSQDE